MNKYQRARRLLKRYRAEIILTVISTMFAVGLGKVVDNYLSMPTKDQIFLSLVATVLLFQIGQMFIIRGNVIRKISRLQNKVLEIWGPLVQSQYNERKQHFAEEKLRLIERLIHTVLPKIIKSALDKTRSDINPKIAIIVDSGTTLENFFPLVKSMGLGPKISDIELETINIYTNSLSGSDGFCRATGGYLHDDQLHLFGGTQMEKYRAVVGDVTQKAMEVVEKDYEGDDDIVIGLITANWLLVGAAYDKLILCSTEKTHLDFKKTIAEMSDYLIVISPLGKLLALDTPAELNTIFELNKDSLPEYNGFEISSFPKRNKFNTTLLTTYRKKTSSILCAHSRKLVSADENNKHELYQMCEQTRSLVFDPNCSYEEQVDIEMPHHYLRSHSFRVLQIHER